MRPVYVSLPVDPVICCVVDVLVHVFNCFDDFIDIGVDPGCTHHALTVAPTATTAFLDLQKLQTTPIKYSGSIKQLFSILIFIKFAYT